jgi:hypothetical protein
MLDVAVLAKIGCHFQVKDEPTEIISTDHQKTKNKNP